MYPVAVSDQDTGENRPRKNNELVMRLVAARDRKMSGINAVDISTNDYLRNVVPCLFLYASVSTLMERNQKPV